MPGKCSNYNMHVQYHICTLAPHTKIQHKTYFDLFHKELMILEHQSKCEFSFTSRETMHI